jgi:MOSC domain-containing protein YiiM
MYDENVYIGDTYEIGDVVLQVNSPRAPCVKINQRYSMKNVDIFIAQNGITGWYFRVLETGTIRVGDRMKLVHRLQNTKSIKEIIHLVRDKDKDLHARLVAAEIPGLAKEWVTKLKKF